MVRETLVPLDEHVDEMSYDDLKLINTMMRLLRKLSIAYNNPKGSKNGQAKGS